MQSSNSVVAVTLTTALAFGLSASAAVANDPVATPVDHTNGLTVVGTDRAITADVRGKLAAIYGVGSRQVAVSTHQGAVTLRGAVRSRADVDKMVAMIQTVHGVEQVDTEGLTVRH